MSTEFASPAIAELWSRAKRIFLSSLPTEEEKNQAERHLNLITSISMEGLTLTVLVATKFAIDLIREKYYLSLKSCLQLSGADPNLQIVIEQDKSAKTILTAPVVKAVNLSKPQNDKAAASPSAVEEPSAVFISTMPLREEYTFEEFVVGPSNSWAYAAAMGVTKNPGEKDFNPLFIHGGTGLGKTHLMQAIGNQIKRNNPNATVCYISAEMMLNEYVNAMTGHTINSFRERYRKIDVLLVDDIQFLQTNMNNFQEEFFNTFNALQGAKKQIVLTSDVAPKDLPGIEERLISRFEGGMVQEIELPSYETRLAILKKKAESSTPAVNDEVLNFIASKIKSHVRAIEGALAKVKMMLSSNPSLVLNEEMLNRILKDFIEKENSRKMLTVEEIQSAVAKKYNLSISQILANDRTQSLVTARQLAMYISRKYTQMGLTEIATHFERSHATIIHGIKAITKRLDVEAELKSNLMEILGEFGYSLEDAF